MGGDLNINLGNLRQAQGFDQLPANTPSDATTPGTTPVEQSLNAFTNAANAGDQPLDTQHQLDYLNRDLKYTDAQNKFTASEEAAAQEMKGVEQQSGDQMAQMVPQLISGLTSSLGGMLGGLVSPLSQLPQQLTQALSQGLGSMQNASSDPLTDEQLLGDEGLMDPLTEDLGAAPGGSETGSPGGSSPVTEPTTTLSAPVAAATFPSSAPTLKGAVASTSSTPQTSMMGGMGGMPMYPPGAMGGNQQQEQKPDTKRVTAPSITNGAPVQGRLTAPPVPPVTKMVQGKPVATRRTNDATAQEAKADEKPA